MPNDARMPNDDCQKCVGKASRECMHLAIRASDFVIGYFVIRLLVDRELLRHRRSRGTGR